MEDADVMRIAGEIWEDGQGNQWVGGEDTTVVAVPGALKYLDVELAAMGIKLKYRVDPKDAPRKGPLVHAEWHGLSKEANGLPPTLIAA
jgi:DNA-directed RNA polymerase I subunit RPA2